MTQKIIPLAGLALALCLASCDDNENEYHATTPSKGQLVCYADQTADSLSVLSYDSWTLSASDTWFRATPTEVNVPNGYVANTPVSVSLSANTTGTNRWGTLTLTCYDNNKLVLPVYQYAWLNVITPEAAITGDTEATFSNWTATFSAELTYNQTVYSLKFQTFADSATLTTNADWAVPAETSFPTKGTRTVGLNLTPNETSAARTATLTLTSGGISTPITIKQQAKPAE